MFTLANIWFLVEGNPRSYTYKLQELSFDTVVCGI